jgi:hypothetical protein
MAAYAATLDLRRDLQQPQEATEALAGFARVAFAQGDIAEACRHVEAILSHLGRGGTFEGTYEPLRIYLTCYRVLQAAGDPRAVAILELAHTTLREQAATIPDQVMRRSFLEQVPYHREIVAEWAADRPAR